MGKWKETDFGKAPEYWKIETIGSLSKKVTDGSHFSPKPHSVGKYMCSVKDMTYNRFDFSNCKLISQNDFNKLVAQGCKPERNDILISKDGANCLDLIFVFDQEEDLVLLSSIAIVRLLPNIDSKFVCYFLLSPACQYIMRNNFVSGSAIPRVVLKDFKKVSILRPPLPEQKAIASVLSSLDDKIDLLHRQNKTLEVIAETLFRQWFVEEAQKNWEDGKIPDEFDYVMGTSPPGESYNEIGAGVPMFQGNADFEFRFPQRRIFTTNPKRFAEKHDTLISVRAPVGAQNMANEKCCIGRGVAAFRYKRNNDYYTYTYFKMKSIMEEIKQFNETGTVFGSISKGDFEAFDVVLPTHNLVDSFQEEVKPIDDKVIANTNQIRTLEKLRDTLLPKLMSGEVRVLAEDIKR